MTVPHNLLAERHVLGAMLLSSHACDIASRIVTADEFYGPAHASTFTACMGLWLAGVRADVTSVSEATRRLPDGVERLTVAELTELTHSAASTDPAHYARIVADHAALRNLQLAGQRIFDQASSLADPAVLADEAQQWISGCYDSRSTAVESGPDLDSFLAEKSTTDWLVPNFLERTDRIILTGAEGRGKSTALRQAGLQMAAGIVPFTSSRPCEPVRVLLVDCENPRGKLQRQLAPLRAAAEGMDPHKFTVIAHDRGLDLAGRADRRWLEERVLANRPEVLITGPLYKLHSGDPNEERPAAKLRDFFDDLRTRFGFALLLEAHQPYASGGAKRPLRPYGASLWSRWPDIGLCLLEQDDGWVFAEWRGQREERSAWPVGLSRNERQRWPWMRPAGDPF